jgi:hypothetical protein
MHRVRKRAAAAVAAAVVAGGAIGATVFSAGASVAQSTTTTPAPAAGTQAGRPGDAGRPHNGQFRPNEDKAHEAGESAAREAQENAGKVPTVP